MRRIGPSTAGWAGGEGVGRRGLEADGGRRRWWWRWNAAAARRSTIDATTTTTTHGAWTGTTVGGGGGGYPTTTWMTNVSVIVGGGPASGRGGDVDSAAAASHSDVIVVRPAPSVTTMTGGRVLNEIVEDESRDENDVPVATDSRLNQQNTAGVWASATSKELSGSRSCISVSSPTTGFHQIKTGNANSTP